jgi:SAM-dependent methyltransferase
MSSEPDYSSIVSHYESCLELHGDTHCGVDWPNKQDAETRYRVMLEIVRQADKPVSLLDFGCGTSHLYEWMRDHGVTGISYSGLDLSPKFVEVSRRKFPEVQYYQADLLLDPDAIPEFDYVIMNGVFTEKREMSYDGMLDYFKRLVATTYRKALRGLAFNVMSHHVDWERAELFHLPHDKLAAFVVGSLSRNYIIRNDYGLYEYTTYVYR